MATKRSGGSPEDAVAALRSIAYRLERAGAETYKVRAFRTAAASAEAAAGELESLWRAGRLQSLPGVGASTAGVLADVLTNGSSSYLDGLEVTPEPQLSEAALKLRRALLGDCHAHSNWSDGGATIAEMAEAARELGHAYLALTDHSPRLTVANGLTRERLLDQLEVVEEVNVRLAPFRLLSGIEVDILEDGSLDQDDDLLERLDVVVASVHSKLRMERDAMTERLVAAVSNPLVDVLGHATGRLITGRGRPESTFDHEVVFAACAAAGTAVEVNSRPERQDPRPELIAVALAQGCELMIDTDAHAPGQLEWQGRGCELAVAAGATAAVVRNTRPAEHLH